MASRAEMMDLTTISESEEEVDDLGQDGFFTEDEEEEDEGEHEMEQSQTGSGSDSETGSGSERENDSDCWACKVCNQDRVGDDERTVECGDCGGMFHMDAPCMSPAMADVPVGIWQCRECTKVQALRIIPHIVVVRANIVSLIRQAGLALVIPVDTRALPVLRSGTDPRQCEDGTSEVVTPDLTHKEHMQRWSVWEESWPLKTGMTSEGISRTAQLTLHGEFTLLALLEWRCDHPEGFSRNDLNASFDILLSRTFGCTRTNSANCAFVRTSAKDIMESAKELQYMKTEIALVFADSKVEVLDDEDTYRMDILEDRCEAAEEEEDREVLRAQPLMIMGTGSGPLTIGGSSSSSSSMMNVGDTETLASLTPIRKVLPFTTRRLREAIDYVEGLPLHLNHALELTLREASNSPTLKAARTVFERSQQSGRIFKELQLRPTGQAGMQGLMTMLFPAVPLPLPLPLPPS